jgi:hypothetical protein
MPYQSASGRLIGLATRFLDMAMAPLTSTWSMPPLTASGRSTPDIGQFSLASGSPAGGVALVCAVGSWAFATAGTATTARSNANIVRRMIEDSLVNLGGWFTPARPEL